MKFWRLLTLFLAPAFLFIPALNASEPAFRISGEPVQGSLLRGRAPQGTVALTLDGQSIPFAADGRFLLGIDRDAAAQMRLVSRLADGREIAHPIAVAPRAWRLERLGIARPTGGPTPAFQRLRDPELARIAAARARASDTTGWQQDFIWPARGGSAVGSVHRRIYRGGVPPLIIVHDVAAGAGAAVVAPADGIVTLAPTPSVSPQGNLVLIDHRPGPEQRLPPSGERLGPGGTGGRPGSGDRDGGRHRPRHRSSSPLGAGLERRQD